jgi:hypothetical protein
MFGIQHGSKEKEFFAEARSLIIARKASPQKTSKSSIVVHTGSKEKEFQMILDLFCSMRHSLLQVTEEPMLLLSAEIVPSRFCRNRVMPGSGRSNRQKAKSQEAILCHNA